MKHSCWLLAVLILSSLLIVACGSSSEDYVAYNGKINDSQIHKVILKTVNNIDHNETQLFQTDCANVNLPANALSSDYDIEITKIETNILGDNDKSLLKSKLSLDSSSEFISPVIGVNIKYTDSYNLRASVNIEGNGVQLYTVSSITINLNSYIFDWDNWFYYVAFRANDNTGWSFTPLKKENFNGKTNQLVVNTNKLSKTYVILKMPGTPASGVIPEIETSTSTSTQSQTNTQTQTEPSTGTSTEINIITGISLLSVPNKLTASQATGCFDEDMNISVGIEYTGNNPFDYTAPTIEFLAFKPFDLGNSVKSVYENGVYYYNYNRFKTPGSDFANLASFTLTLPTKGIKYDSDKFPENIFVTAKFKSQNNKDYQTFPTSIAFCYEETKSEEPIIATPTVILNWLNIYAEPSQLAVTESETTFQGNIVIEGGLAYENATSTFDLTPLYVEFNSASSFDLGNNIVSTFADDVYTYRYEVPEKDIIIHHNKKTASFSVTLPLKNVTYNSNKHPAAVFVKSKYDKYESNPIAIKLVNEADGSISVVTTFPGKGNVINGNGFVTLDTSWTGSSSPYKVKYTCNNQLLSQISVSNKNTANTQISGSSIGDSNGSLKFIRVKVAGSDNSNLETISDGFIIDTQEPVLIATITNDKVFGTKETIKIEITSNETVAEPSVVCEGIKATMTDALNAGTKFIYSLQLNENFTTGKHSITIIASDTSEPTITANSSTTEVTFSVDTSITYPFAHGSGTEDDPFLIATAEDLNNVRFYPIYYYKQIADINLEEFIAARTDLDLYPTPTDTNSTAGWLPIDFLSKTYDGNNHKIIGLWINRSSNNVGLFGLLPSTAIIKNINLENSGKSIIGESFIGSIVGNGQASIVNCNSNINVVCNYSSCIDMDGDYVGGIAGCANSIKNCSFDGFVGGSSYVGGLAGKCENIADSVTSGFSYAHFYVGGIVGFHQGGTITNCSTTSNISAKRYIGGIVGKSENSIITNCNNEGNLKSDLKKSCSPSDFLWTSPEENEDFESGYMGGIVGYAIGQYSKVNNCKSICNITGTNSSIGSKDLGGIIGYSKCNNLTISKCLYEGTIFPHDNPTTPNYSGTMGGIIASSFGDNTTVTQCYAKAIIYGDCRNTLGGIVGHIGGNNVIVEKCISECNLDLNPQNDGREAENYFGPINFNSSFCSGGIVGYTYGNNIEIKNNISNCVFSDREYALYIGGIAGFVSGTRIKNNYSLSSIPQKRSSKGGTFGGILGKCSSAILINNLMLGRYIYDPRRGFTGSDTAGRIASIPSGAMTFISNYSWNGVYNGVSVDWTEPCGANTSHGEDVYKSDFWSASTQSSFWSNPEKLGWDFDNVWEFRDGYNLPQLRSLPSVEDPDYIN